MQVLFYPRLIYIHFNFNCDDSYSEYTNLYAWAEENGFNVYVPFDENDEADMELSLNNSPPLTDDDILHFKLRWC